MSEASPIISVERLKSFVGSDLEDLCTAADAAIEDGGGFGWLKPPRRHLFESYWKGILLVPERQVLVGRLDGTIVGSAQIVRPSRNNEAQAHQAQLTTSFVAPWARGHGIARLLAESAEGAAQAMGATVINLDVRETQVAAIQLYESLGYVRWGEHPAYARVGGKLVRGFFYYKVLEGAGR